MKRTTWISLVTTIGLVIALAVPTVGIAHELELTSASFTGSNFFAAAQVTGSVDHIGVDVFDGGFRFDGQKGKPAGGEMANGFAINEEWWDNGDGTCTIFQETWEAQSMFWTEDQPGATVTFSDEYTGSMSVSYVMHGIRSTYENHPFDVGDYWCGWNEEPPTSVEHLGDVVMTVDAEWESDVVAHGKGKKNRGQEIVTTVTFTALTFDGQPLEIVFSDEPLSPYAFSGSVRMEVPLYNYIDNH